jgi:hypothetical protein
MEATAVVRFVHILAGVSGLISFPLPLVVAKGNRTHRLAGRVHGGEEDQGHFPERHPAPPSGDTIPDALRSHRRRAPGLL